MFPFVSIKAEDNKIAELRECSSESSLSVALHSGLCLLKKHQYTKNYEYGWSPEVGIICFHHSFLSFEETFCCHDFYRRVFMTFCPRIVRTHVSLFLKISLMLL